VIWPQALLSFLVWLAYGVWMRRRSDALRARLAGMSRARRVFLGSAGLVLSAFGLLAGLVAVSAMGGLREGALTPWAWLAVTVLGLGFVHMQVLGAAAMISLVQDRETHRPEPPSESPKDQA
jgi:hypothetical protein